MAIERFITLTLAVVAAAALAASMPTKKELGKLDLSDAINKTVCPIKIEINDDPKRIPRRIKEMKCREDPNVWCSKNHIPSNECCQHQHAAVHMQCVEIQDWVQVYYPETDDTQTSRVSVGCMCVMQQDEMAQDSQPS